MAKTTRKKSTVKARTSKKKSKVKKVIKKEKESLDCLTSQEIMNIESLTNSSNVTRLKMATQDQYVKTIILEIENKTYELEKARNDQHTLSVRYTQANQKAQNKINQLKEKYKVKGDLAYDRLSGEIVCK